LQTRDYTWLTILTRKEVLAMGNLFIGLCLGFAGKRILKEIFRLIHKFGLDKKIKSSWAEIVNDQDQ
jgi:uncharacterized membrane protein